MLEPEQQLLIKYVSYCMTEAFKAGKDGEYLRMFAFKRLAGILLHAHPTPISLQDNLLNHWPKQVTRKNFAYSAAFQAACEEVRLLIEQDMCYTIVLDFRTQWQAYPAGPVGYALRDVVQQLENHGSQGALEVLGLYAGQPNPYGEAWLEEKRTIYLRAIKRIEEYQQALAKEEISKGK